MEEAGDNEKEDDMSEDRWVECSRVAHHAVEGCSQGFSRNLTAGKVYVQIYALSKKKSMRYQKRKFYFSMDFCFQSHDFPS